MSAQDQTAIHARPPARKLFHGWYIVMIGFLAHFGYSTSFSSTLSVFFKPMSEEFGWPRTYLSGVRSFENLFFGIVGSLIGPFLDRHGTRAMLVFGGITCGVGLIWLGLIGDSLQFFLVRGLVVGMGTVAISHMVVSVAVSNWFVRLRGRALGISGSGASVGKVIMAPLITALMGVWGWREAWVVLGLLVLVAVPLPAALFVRRRPEDVGLRPDGDSLPQAGASTTSSDARPGPPSAEVVWSRSEAIRTSAFWLIVLTFSVAHVGSLGMALHMIPYLTDIGFSPGMAAAALSILSVFQLVGNLGWGFVVERVSIRYCAMVMFLVEAAGVAAFLYLRDPVPVIVGLVAYGFSLSGTSVLQDIVWANYFGRLSLGAIRSVGMPLSMLFSAGGPLYFGYLYDSTGSYDIALLGFMTALVISAGMVLACKPPKQRPEPKQTLA